MSRTKPKALKNASNTIVDEQTAAEIFLDDFKQAIEDVTSGYIGFSAEKTKPGGIVLTQSYASDYNKPNVESAYKGRYSLPKEYFDFAGEDSAKKMAENTPQAKIMRELLTKLRKSGLLPNEDDNIINYVRRAEEDPNDKSSWSVQPIHKKNAMVMSFRLWPRQLKGESLSQLKEKLENFKQERLAIPDSLETPPPVWPEGSVESMRQSFTEALGKIIAASGTNPRHSSIPEGNFQLHVGLAGLPETSFGSSTFRYHLRKGNMPKTDYAQAVFATRIAEAMMAFTGYRSHDYMVFDCRDEQFPALIEAMKKSDFAKAATEEYHAILDMDEKQLTQHQAKFFVEQQIRDCMSRKRGPNDIGLREAFNTLTKDFRKDMTLRIGTIAEPETLGDYVLLEMQKAFPPELMKELRAEQSRRLVEEKSNKTAYRLGKHTARAMQKTHTLATPEERAAAVAAFAQELGIDTESLSTLAKVAGSTHKNRQRE